MTAVQLSALTPLIIVAATACIALVLLSFKRSHLTIAVLTIAGLLLSFEQLLQMSDQPPLSINSLLTIDRFALFIFGFMLLAAVLITILTYIYMRRRSGQREELYVLILIATLGSMVLSAAGSFVSFILGLETLTVALYVMIGYLENERLGIEAAVKYLILAAAASAFLLLGAGLIYFDTGAMSFDKLALISTGGNISWPSLLGVVLLLVGVGFKLGVVPFHMWTPDVYAGAPAPVTAFIATISKSAMVAVLIRFFIAGDLTQQHALLWIVSAIAVTSMIAGNLLALMQRNLKRLLAYSSIAHLGYVLVGVVIGGTAAYAAVAFYLVVYSLTLIGAFGTISILSSNDSEPYDLESYRGLFWTRPGLAAILTIMMLSLAGIPLTAGFIAKFLILSAGVGAAAWTLAVTLVVTSAIGLFYYLRVIATMLRQDENESILPAVSPVSGAGRLLLAVITLAVIYFGIFAGDMLDVVTRAVRQLIGA